MRIGLSAVLFVILFSSCANPAAKFEIYNTVPDFTLTDSKGEPFQAKQLKGKVWVADFIYTNCPGPCPRMTSQMHRLVESFSGDNSAQFVSFSVDPDRDTPGVLHAFAQRFGGPTPAWHFLTGKPQVLGTLARHVFLVGDLIGKMDHSTKFSLVDRQGRIRGYYSTFERDGIQKLTADVKALAASGQ